MKINLKNTILALAAFAMVGGVAAAGVTFGQATALVTNAAENDTHDFAQSLSQLLNNGADVDPINIANQGYPIKKIIISWSHNKTGTNGVDMIVSVGGEAVETVTIGNKKSQTTTINVDNLSGAVNISFDNKCTSSTGQGTLTVSNVRLVEGATAALENPITAISAVSLTSTSVPVNFKGDLFAEATIVPNDTDEVVRWASSDDSVATITPTDTNGVGRISIVGLGTCHFTASNQDGSVSCDSAVFTVTEKQLVNSISIVRSSLVINDSSASSLYDKYKGAQEEGGLELDIASVMPNTNAGKDVVQMKKTDGVIKNTAAFTYGVKMVRFTGEGTPLAKFAIDDTASTATNSSVSVKLGDSWFFVPSGLESDAEYFYLSQSSSNTGYYTSISILAEEPAAKAFAEMYLSAYTCDATGGSSTAIKSGYTIANLGTLFNALDAGVQDILTDAVKAHTQSYGEDVIKEFAQRYYWINHNHGTSHDFMGLDGTVNFNSYYGNVFEKNSARGELPLIITLVTVAGLATGGMVLLSRKRKRA